MKILLTGVETKNKGAELMLYAILKEIEKKHPEAIVYIEKRNAQLGGNYKICTSLTLKILEHPLNTIIKRTRINSILARLHLKTFYFVPQIPSVDYVLDGSGLHFSDKMDVAGKYYYWKKILMKQSKAGAKIVFLPQAFGPIEKKSTKNGVKLISDYATLICARERISYDYLQSMSDIWMDKVKIYPDFTSLVEGNVPLSYNHLRGSVCIIPNSQMVNKGVVSTNNYIEYIQRIVDGIRACGKNVFLLNHQGINDQKLLDLCKTKIKSIECVSGLNAIETKGLISISYLVVTSRFHGLASALNSGVPSLATSWSHKYQCLFADYNQLEDCVLTLTNIDADITKVKEFLDPLKNAEIRKQLLDIVPQLKTQTTKMWDDIWNV